MPCPRRESRTAGRPRAVHQPLDRLDGATSRAPHRAASVREARQAMAVPHGGTFDLPSCCASPSWPPAALGAAREEIDALNVYPVPDGDTGTNMFLTVEAARDAAASRPGRRRSRRGPGRPAAPALARLRPRRAARRPRQLRGDPDPAARRAVPADRARPARATAPPRCSPTASARPPRPATPRSASRSRAPSSRSPGPPPRRPAARPRTPRPRLGDVVTAAAAARPGGPGPHARPAAGACATPAWSTPAGAGCAWSSTPPRPRVTGRRPRRSTASRRRRQHPGPACRRRGRPDRRRAGLRGDVPARRRRRRDPRRCARRWPPLGDSLVVVGGDGLWNVHVHVDDVGAAVEAGIEAGRPHRVRVTHFAEQVGPGRASAARRAHRPRASSPSPPAPGWRRCSARPAPRWSRAGPGRRPVDRRAARGDRRLRRRRGGRAAQRPPTRSRAAEAAARTAEEDHGVRVAVIPTTGAGAGPGRARRARAGPHLRAGRRAR